MKSDIQCEPDGLIKVFDKSESAEIEKKWMLIFCKNKQGFNTKAFKWHIFSGEGYPSIEGEDARKAYELKEEQKYIVMGNDNELAILTNKNPFLVTSRTIMFFLLTWLGQWHLPMKKAGWALILPNILI